MAVALVIFARWNPLACFGAALLFGAAGALGPALQSVGITQGYYFFNAAPYVLTLLIMIVSTLAEALAEGRAGRTVDHQMRPARNGTRRDACHDCRPATRSRPTPIPGRSTATLRPDNTALIVIDMQTDFCGIGGYVDKMGYDLSLTRAPIEPIQRVLAAMRARGYHVIHTREGHRPDLSDLPGEQALALAPDRRRHRRRRARAGASWCAASRAGRSSPSWRRSPARPIIDKPGKGSFCATDLELILRTSAASAISC